MRINLFCVCLIYSRERSATCINEYPLVERFIYLFMCVLQWISIYEIHFGSRGYSFGIAIIFFPRPPSPYLNFRVACHSVASKKTNEKEHKEGDGKEKSSIQNHLRVIPIGSLIQFRSFCAFDPPALLHSANCVSSVHFALDTPHVA